MNETCKWTSPVRFYWRGAVRFNWRGMDCAGTRIGQYSGISKIVTKTKSAETHRIWQAFDAKFQINFQVIWDPCTIWLTVDIHFLFRWFLPNIYIFFYVQNIIEECFGSLTRGFADIFHCLLRRFIKKIYIGYTCKEAQHSIAAAHKILCHFGIFKMENILNHNQK